MTTKKLIELAHKLKMEEIAFELKCKKEMEAIRFDNNLQLQRIKTAEIKRVQNRKADKQFAEGYHR